MPDIFIYIDGKRVKAKSRATLLSVCRQKGIEIPTLCWMEGLSPYGACRLCTVGLLREGWVKYVTACNFPVEKGQRFETASKRVLAVRRLVVESLLARCPEVDLLKELARKLGVKRQRFTKRRDPDRCILCGMCVNVCGEVVGAHAIGFVGRGVDRQVGTPFGILPEACIGCGACAAVCPTGAIDMESKAVARFREAEQGSERWCRYARMGLVPPAICPTSFECWRCEVDQRLRLRYSPHPMLYRTEQGCSLDAGVGKPDETKGRA